METTCRRYMTAALICTAICFAFLTGCNRAEKKEDELPDVFPLEFVFSSGAGAWQTSVILNRDGSFEGEHYDSDGGDQGDDYPHGTVYICDFSGQFENIKKVDDHTYSMELRDIKAGKEKGGEWVEDGMRFIVSTPYGLEGGREFLLYTPKTPVEGLPEKFLEWWPGWYDAEPEGDGADTLSCYGLYNQEMGYGLFTYE